MVQGANRDPDAGPRVPADKHELDAKNEQEHEDEDDTYARRDSKDSLSIVSLISTGYSPVKQAQQ